MHFLEYEPAQARQKLEEALSRPPCPVDADQVEDVRTFLGLLRQRVALLPDPAGDPLDGPTSVPSLGLVGSPAIAPRPASPSRTRASRSPKRGSAQTVHRLKITLRGSKPPIWRRLEFPSVGSLRLLHESIQESFGWDDYHLWVFATPFGDYGLPDRELGYQAAVSKKLMAVAPGVGEKLRYTYDFGDDWVHEILVEDITAAAPGTAYPRCIAGRRACPPEDSGGMRGYGALLEVLANPEHPEHEERREWLGLAPGEVFDPADFDLEGTDRRLSGIATVLVSR
ncbi:MAG: plasmid pRiA4b ORF-3 family protein [Dactylosporangium sp.]|nr:plasmid pRiA4b ORF-3 family protein [Dactylosporangium sp.]